MDPSLSRLSSSTGNLWSRAAEDVSNIGTRVGCHACSFYPDAGPDQEKKMKKHLRTVRHLRTTGAEVAEVHAFKCRHCEKTYSRRDNLVQHEKSHFRLVGDDEDNEDDADNDDFDFTMDSTSAAEQSKLDRRASFLAPESAKRQAVVSPMPLVSPDYTSKNIETWPPASSSFGRMSSFFAPSSKQHQQRHGLVEPVGPAAELNQIGSHPTSTGPYAFTDSGYGSHGTKTIMMYEAPVCEPAVMAQANLQAGGLRSSSPSSHEIDNDTDTVYSDTASLQDPKLYDYVIAFADELNNALPSDLSREDLENISDALPAILEEFANRIGYQRTVPGRVRRKVKYLAYKYRLQIADLVRNRRNDPSEDVDAVPDSPRSPGLDFRDKVVRWMTESDMRLSDHDVFPDDKNVDDDLSDDEELPELSLYREALTKAPAYEWLLSALQVQRKLWVPGDQCTQAHIRQHIIKSFRRPMTYFSRDEQAEVEVIFYVDWDPMEFMKTQYVTTSSEKATMPSEKTITPSEETRRPLKKPKSTFMFQTLKAPFEEAVSPVEEALEQHSLLERVVTLTGHGNHVQATTCLAYMSQTWPKTGKALLRYLCRVFQSEDTLGNLWRPEGSLPGVALIRAALKPVHDGSTHSPMLQLHVTANVFAVAEVGEQLAWLGAALRSSPTESKPLTCSPYIRDIYLDPSSLIHIMSQRFLPRGVCSIGFKLGAMVETAQFDQGSCWRNLFSNPVIVTGYPIPRGQNSDPGTQISLDLAAALIHSNRIVRWSGTTFIKGFSALLVVTKMVKETVFWHLVFNEDGSYISYEDARVPRWSRSDSPFVLETIGHYRHVVGWCDRIVSHAGAPDADYEIGWSGLPGPNQTCALEKATISGGQFVNFGMSFVLGLKDKPIHINYGDNYIEKLRIVSDRFFVLFDSDERQAWLVDGASTLLHLLRSSIKNYQDDPRMRRLLSSPDNIELEEPKSSQAVQGSRADVAFEVLSDSNNLAIPLYSDKTEAWDEATFRTGVPAEHSAKQKTTYFTIRDRVDQICDTLLQITAHHDDVQTQSGVGFRLLSTPRRQLEGYDFMDITASQGTLWPKVATLKTTGQGWVDFTRAIHAPTLFGSGFGNIFAPSFSSTPETPSKASCSLCLWNTSLPAGKDYLAATTHDLQAIIRKKGSQRLKPWRLVDNIHWYTPDLTFEPCACSPEQSAYSRGWLAKHDRVQVLLPSSFPKLWGRESPKWLSENGAVIFGHSSKFPLIWPRRSRDRDLSDHPVPGEPRDDVEEVEALFQDSGLGSSLGSRSQSETEKQQLDASSAESVDMKSKKSSLPLDQGTHMQWGRRRPNPGSLIGSSSGIYGLENSQFIHHGQDEADRRGEGEGGKRSRDRDEEVEDTAEKRARR
ncbi:hypothetical protein B0T21DRAFT_360949 [Apiosordaria backusii]|uniref:C2H2-type domain-containing protein n=1 Tax=Apiosordaria backusii TaxID=314023 RepID=A0AA40EMV0_9PEZI|nr:hypothetical protein B0T21DRAFT_360949 [Apiosordaria backusii]